MTNTAFKLQGKSILGNLISSPPVDRAIRMETLEAAEWIPIGNIRKGGLQPRQFFSQESIKSLAQSFKTQGFRGALNVRPLGDGMYELIAGERRLRAATLVGLEKVRCIVEVYSDEEALEFALVENLQREDLSKLEETEGILQLIETRYGIGRDRAIAIIRTEGHSDQQIRSHVAPSEELRKIQEVLSSFHIELQTFRTKNLRTISLPEDLKRAHLERSLPYSSAIELSKIKDESARQQLLEKAISEALSFRDIKKYVQEATTKQSQTEVPEVNSLVRRLVATVKQVKRAGHLFEATGSQQLIEEFISKLEILLENSKD